MEEPKQDIRTDEIDLVEVAKKIWAERKLIIKITLVFLLLGLIIAFGTPKEYKAETTLLIETGGGSSMNGLLQQFGGLAGISLGAGQEGVNLNPDIYPEIVQSTPFLVELMGENIHSEKLDSSISVSKYLSTYVKPSVIGVIFSYTFGLPGKISSLFKKKEKPEDTLPQITNSPITITKAQKEIMESIKSRIKLTPDDANGSLKISAEMPDPLAAADMANAVYKYLAKYLIEYKVQKVKADLDFINEQHAEARQRYMDAQQRLALYRDANRNVMLSSFRTEEERLQNEYILSFNVYNGLSQQLEQSKLKVQEKTPVLKVIDPVKVPLEKSKPKRSLILAAMIFVGGFLGVGLVFFKIIAKNFNKAKQGIL